MDPLSPIMNAAQGQILMKVDRYEDAIASMLRAADLDPNLGLVHLWLMWAYILVERYDDAERSARLGAALIGEDPEEYATMVRAVEDPELLKRQALEILATSADKHWELSPATRAQWYALLGENDLALESLAGVVDGGLGNANAIRHPTVKPLSGDPRFADLLERLGLPE